MSPNAALIVDPAVAIDLDLEMNSGFSLFQSVSLAPLRLLVSELNILDEKLDKLYALEYLTYDDTQQTEPSTDVFLDKYNQLLLAATLSVQSDAELVIKIANKIKRINNQFNRINSLNFVIF